MTGWWFQDRPSRLTPAEIQTVALGLVVVGAMAFGWWWLCKQSVQHILLAANPSCGRPGAVGICDSFEGLTAVQSAWLMTLVPVIVLALGAATRDSLELAWWHDIRDWRDAALVMITPLLVGLAVTGWVHHLLVHRLAAAMVARPADGDLSWLQVQWLPQPSQSLASALAYENAQLINWWLPAAAGLGMAVVAAFLIRDSLRDLPVVIPVWAWRKAKQPATSVPIPAPRESPEI